MALVRRFEDRACSRYRDLRYGRNNILPKAHFADRLADAVRTKRTPLVVGLDPRWKNLPSRIREKYNSDSVQSTADAYRQFCFGVIDTVADLVPAVKPQFAFFEQLGPAGFKALSDVVSYAKQSGLLVIGDAKRGDIGSTAIAYANAYLNPASTNECECDALTVNPYMGFDTIQPFAEVAESAGNGLFVLVKTSNPGSGDLQDLELDSSTLFQRVADWLERENQSDAGESGYGLRGAVVGATYPGQLEALRKRAPHTTFLIPGFGAQGGSAVDVAAGFDSRGLGAVVNSSRGIIFAHENEKYSGCSDWQQAVKQATLDSIAQLREHTPAGNL